MPTGACGINCDVCKLRLLDICSSCGPGNSVEASAKLVAQKRIFGGECSILACARLNRIEYCLRDCNSFPCENFGSGPYPYSEGFLRMQERRRNDRPPAVSPNRTLVDVPPEYWEKLGERDLSVLCNITFATPHGSRGLVLRSLNRDILVDIEDRCLKTGKDGGWDELDDPLLEIVTLLYLTNVDTVYPFGKDIVSVKDLKEAHYFKDQHAIRLDPLLERYGNAPEAFKEAAEYLDGKAVDMADIGYMLLPFPRVPLYYLMWRGDEEFRPKVTVLFDRPVERWLSASAIWMLTKVVSTALLIGPRPL